MMESVSPSVVGLNRIDGNIVGRRNQGAGQGKDVQDDKDASNDDGAGGKSDEQNTVEGSANVGKGDAAGNGGHEENQQVCDKVLDGQRALGDKKDGAHAGGDAINQAPRGAPCHRTLCLRELDLHKCAIMPPVITPA